MKYRIIKINFMSINLNIISKKKNRKFLKKLSKILISEINR